MQNLHRLVRLTCAAVLFANMAGGADARAQSASIGNQFNTVNLSQSGFIPPDTMGAVGPDHFVTIVNGRIAVFNKDGSAVSATSDSAFFSSLGLSGSAGDPRIHYDPLSRRWFAINFTGTSNNSVLIARTDGTNPSALNNTGWKGTSFVAGTGGRFADFPTLGIDANGLYIATNNFNVNPFSTSIFSIPKADIVQAVPTTANRSSFQNLDGTTAANRGFANQGAVNFGPKLTTDPTPILGASSTQFSQNKFATLTGTAAAGATLSATTTFNTINSTAVTTSTTASFGSPSPALEAGDDRYGSNVVQVGNRLFGVRRAQPSGNIGLIRLSVINATTGAIVTEATISNATTSYIYPSIAVNTSGDLVVGFSATGTAAANAAAIVVGSYNFGSDTISLGSVQTIQNGNGTYNVTFGSGRNRWGDYSATTIDPTDPGIFWTHQEYTSSTNNWTTQASEIIPNKANEIRWRPRVTGALTTGSNYFTGAAPGASDHVIFSRGNATYTVNTMAGVTNDRASVRQGNVTWDATGGTYTMSNANAATPSLAVGDFQGTTSLTMTAGNFSTVNSTIGSGYGGSGTVRLTNSGTTWNNSGTAYVGGDSTAPRGGTGVLRVDAGATLSGGAVRVWSGGTVTGTGTITAPITVSGGAATVYSDGTMVGTNKLAINSVNVAAATISPGNSVGTLTTGTVNINTAGRYLWEISNAGTGGVAPNTGLSGGVKDLIDATGDINLSSMEMAINGLGGTGFNNLLSYSWVIGTATGAINISGTNAFTPNAEFAAAGGNVYSLGTSSGVLYLNYGPVPEPTTILAVCAVVGGAAGLWRRRRSK